MDKIVQDWIADVRVKAKGRTRYEGQEPYQDETVVAYIDQLEREIAEARGALDAVKVDARLLVAAIDAGDPQKELRLRAVDIQRRVDEHIAAFEQVVRGKGGRG